VQRTREKKLDFRSAFRHGGHQAPNDDDVTGVSQEES
jgi:hypothetical protein